MILFAAAIRGAEFVQVPEAERAVVDSATGFRVTVKTGAFWIGRTEVTQQEFSRVMGTNPSHDRGPGRPVETVTWFDAISYANRRSQLERLTPCYNLPSGTRRANCTGYRLPTSTEWTLAFDAETSAVFRSGGYMDAASLIAAARQGTRPAATGSAGRKGLFDMAGNVWEWCEDWYSAAPALDSVRDPQGPPSGVARVIRGGSFLTGGTQWNKELLSSFDPASRSRFTGFRLARTASAAPRPEPPDAAFLAKFQEHRPVNPGSVALSRTNDEIRKIWLDVLGAPKLPTTSKPVRAVRSFRDPTWNGELLDLQIEPGAATRLLIAGPVRKPAGRLPVILVPFYDVDAPAGADLGGRRIAAGSGTRAFARIAAQHGFLAVAIKWFGESGGEGYDEAVLNLTTRHSGVTPLGKWIWDLQRVIDYLVSRPDVDSRRIGMIGHSLGGKMTLYASAFEPRVRVIVASEPGISLKFSNYGDFWYLGKAIERLPKDADHHELLALIAPRPFLLIAGESADGDKSWPLLAAAQTRYPVKEHLGMLNHRAGHSPTEESVIAAFEWLERFLR